MYVSSQYHSIVSWTTINQSNESLSSSILFDNDQLHILTRPFIWTVLLACCLSTIIVLTILGNILVLIALCIDFALRSPTHLLMGNLACADLLLGITVLPFSATLEILNGQWLFGPTFCHIWLAIDVLYCTASIYGLMSISIERYIGVTRPLRYPLIITHRRTFFAIILAWLVSIFISLVPFFGWKNKITSTERTCQVNDNLSYVIFSCLFSFYIPLIVILCVYGRVYGEAIRQYQFLTDGEKKVRVNESIGQECITLRVHIPQQMSLSTSSLSIGYVPNRKRSSTQLTSTGTSKLSKFKRERKAAKTLGIVVGMFILCWSPFFLLLPIKALTNYDFDVIFPICFWLGYCNSCFNPFIYAFSSREFRRAFKTILKCQRTPFQKTSTSFYRISATTLTDQVRFEKSQSCDITAMHSLRQSDSIISYRTSCDSQRQFIPLNKQKRFLDRPELALFRRISNPTVSHSAPLFDNSSPWHRRNPHLFR